MKVVEDDDDYVTSIYKKSSITIAIIIGQVPDYITYSDIVLSDPYFLDAITA